MAADDEQDVAPTPAATPAATPIPAPAPPPAGPGLLGYVTDDAYRPTGRVGAGGLMASLFGGLAAALVAALLAVAWILSPLPNWYVLPIVAQGVAVGGALAWLFRRSQFRSPAGAAAVGVVCGLASALFFHGALYVKNVYDVRNDVLADIESRAASIGDADAVRRIQAEVRAHPFRLFDRLVTLPQTGRAGFVGYMAARESIVWVFGFIQVIAVTWISTKLGRMSASRPFCEDCRTWFLEPYNAAVLPAEMADPLVIAIEADDPSQVMELHAAAALAAGPDLGGACAVAKLQTCPSCGKRLAEVVVKTYGEHVAGESARLKPRRVSPETAEALKYEPSDAAVADAGVQSP